MVTSMEKALNAQWEKTLPLPIAASYLCQHFGVWKPKAGGNDHAELLSMEGVKRG